MQDTPLSQPNDSMIGKLLVASTTVQDPILSRSVCLVVHQDTENVFAVLLNRPMTPPPGLVNLLHPPALGAPEAAAGHGKQRFGSVDLKSHSYPANLPETRSPQAADTAADTAATEAAGMVDQEPSQSKFLMAKQTAAEASKSLGTIHFGGPLSGPVVAVHNSSEHAESQAGKGVYVAARRELLETLVKQRPGDFRLIVGHLGWSISQLHAEHNAGFWHIMDATDENVFTGDQDLWPSVIRRATSGSVANWLGINDTPFAAEVN